MGFLLRRLRENTRRAGITLPKHLTVNPDDDKAAYADWRRQIDDYRQAAGVRAAKTRPAPA